MIVSLLWQNEIINLFTLILRFFISDKNSIVLSSNISNSNCASGNITDSDSYSFTSLVHIISIPNSFMFVTNPV